MNTLNINMGKLKDNLSEHITPEMQAFVESQIGRENLALMSEEAWLDFLLGVSLYGISVGITSIN